MRRTISVFLLVTVILVLIVQIATGLLGQRDFNLEQEAVQEEGVRLSFDPALGFAAPNATLRMMIDAPLDEVVFLYVRLEFDHTKLNLSNEVQITGELTAERVTNKNQANATGQIEVMLALPAGEYGVGPLGTYELASFDFEAVTSESDLPISLEAIDRYWEVVDVENFDVIVDIEPASLVLNPATCGPPAADACADLGATSDEAHHDLMGWSIYEENSPTIPPTGDDTKRFQLLHGDSSLTLSVPHANAPYLLLTEVEDGGCDDSFEIYVNGQGPLYSYQADPTLEGIGVMHIVSVPRELISTTDVLVMYRNTASDSCGYAAVFNSKLILITEHSTYLPLVVRN